VTVGSVPVVPAGERSSAGIGAMALASLPEEEVDVEVEAFGLDVDDSLD
jgi:hypothetical protein